MKKIILVLFAIVLVSTVTSGSCPEGWTLVPGNANYGTSDFCIMKYEAKNDGGAVSQAAGTPWVSITQTSAIAECSAIGAHLCTVNETQTINRNIEAQAANWDSGTVGSGKLARGWTANTAFGDSWTDTAVASLTDSSCVYNTGADTCGAAGTHLYKRTHNLSNSEIIWDWSGNIREWIYGEGSGGTIGTTGGISWRNTPGGEEWNVADLDEERIVLGPSNNAWTTTNAMGRYHGGVDTNAFLRGGSWNQGSYAGVFALYLGYAPSVSGTIIGFRCVQAPTSSGPTSSNFTSTETTNFSEATLSNVTSLTLAIDNKGKIAFPSGHSVNAEGEDYDTNVKIEDAMIYVDSAALDSSFNSSATLTFYNVDCNKPYIFYSESASTFAAILSENQRCPESLCQNIQCTSNTLTVNVEHFTGYAAGTNANLTIEAEAGIKYPLDSIAFYAWYINSTDGTPISGECNISFDDAWGTWFEMDYNGSQYNYTKSLGFDAAGTHHYNVTCSSANFVTLEANDTKIVSSVDIPEFSTITLGMGLIAVLSGLFIIRKKK